MKSLRNLQPAAQTVFLGADSEVTPRAQSWTDAPARTCHTVPAETAAINRDVSALSTGHACQTAPLPTGVCRTEPQCKGASHRYDRPGEPIVARVELDCHESCAQRRNRGKN